jgi:glutamate-5-semialdehyde dehydrogenase
LEHELKLKKIKAAAKQLRLADVKKRNLVLKRAADLLLKSTKEVLAANALDLDSLDKSVTASFRDRLVLNEMRIKHMALSLKQVAALADPLATESKIKILKNGLKLKKVRAPLGVVFMIFESRPNVAFEAFSMGFKSGNAMILRGGKESQRTTKVLYKILNKSVQAAGLPADVLWGITDSDREIVNQLLTQKEYIDVVVPRGGEGLINFVVENSLIPIIKNDRGLCHVYVNDDAKLDMAVDILVNAKTQRPAVCNSMETILVHRKIAGKLLPKVYERMQKFNVQWFGCHETRKILKKYPHVSEATEINYNTEYLEQIVNCKVVSGVTEAMEHIEKFGSRHSECIVTQKVKLARQFQNEVDAAVVYWNASTRFTDGFEFGLGGELGISTQKLHVRGPVGLQALTNERWVVDGKGQIRS